MRGSISKEYVVMNNHLNVLDSMRHSLVYDVASMTAKLDSSRSFSGAVLTHFTKVNGCPIDGKISREIVVTAFAFIRFETLDVGFTISNLRPPFQIGWNLSIV